MREGRRIVIAQRSQNGEGWGRYRLERRKREVGSERGTEDWGETK